MMNFKKLSFGTLNVGGLKNKQRIFKTVNKINELKLDIIFLQETINNNLDIFKINKYNVIYNKYTTTIINNEFKILDLFSSKCSRFLAITIEAFEEKYLLINLYLNVNYTQRKIFMNSQFKKLIETCKINNYLNIIIGGDLNMLLNPKKDKKPSSIKYEYSSKIFNKFIFQNTLFDVNLNNDNVFTRIDTFNKSASNIDRLFVSNNIFNKITKSLILPVTFSDHMMLYSTMIIKHDLKIGKNIWKCNNSVLRNTYINIKINALLEIFIKECMDQKILYTWDIFKSLFKKHLICHSKFVNQSIKTNNLENMYLKLKNYTLKPNLFNNINKIINIKQQINNIENNLMEKNKTIFKLKTYEFNEKPNKYFFNAIKSKNERNNIYKLKNKNQQKFHDNESMCKIAYEFFNETWTEQKDINKSDQNFFLNFIKTPTVNQKNIMNSPITIEEIKDVIKKSPKNSSPGPDGLSYEFYLVFIDKISIILKELFNIFIQNEKDIPYNLIRNNIILIFKKDDKEDLKNYRPLTLSNVDIKILSKILNNRLKTIINNFIEKEQIGFIPNESIYKNIFVLDTILKNDNIKNDQNILCIDYEKAYDKINWNWIFMVLNKFGLDGYLTNFLKNSYFNSRSSIIINNNKTKSIKVNRGIKQGCSLSPFIFNLVMNPFMTYIKMQNKGFDILTYKINIVGYADDIVIFNHNKKELYKTIDIIKRFENSSNLKMNFNKSFLISNNDKISNEIKIIKENDNFDYLGFIFKKNGIDEKMNEEKILNKIKKISTNLRFRNLSFIGKTKAINSLMLSQTYYVGTLMYFSKEFFSELNILIKNIYKSNNKTSYNLLNGFYFKNNKETFGLNLINAQHQNLALKAKEYKLFNNNDDVLKALWCNRFSKAIGLKYIKSTNQPWNTLAFKKFNFKRKSKDNHFKAIVEIYKKFNGETDFKINYINNECDNNNLLKNIESTECSIKLLNDSIYQYKVKTGYNFLISKINNKWEIKYKEKFEYFKLWNNIKTDLISSSIFNKCLNNKIQSFIYKIINFKFRSYETSKYFSDKINCFRCKSGIDNYKHRFLDCYLLTSTWKYIKKVLKINNFFNEIDHSKREININIYFLILFEIHKYYMEILINKKKYNMNIQKNRIISEIIIFLKSNIKWKSTYYREYLLNLFTSDSCVNIDNG